MPVSSRHPQYVEFEPDWVLMQDCLAGERKIKSKGVEYLPATSGMYAFGLGKEPGGQGALMYDGYRVRAHFPPFTEDATEALLGIMHRRPPDITLPTRMEPLRGKATVEGESLDLLLRKINLMQMVPGRVGLLADLPSQKSTDAIPKIAIYDALSIINWDEGIDLVPQKLNLVVLNETAPKRIDQFQWQDKTQYRVLTLGQDPENESEGLYSQEIFEDEQSMNTIIPEFRGKKLKEIPFTFINSIDLVAAPRKSPLLGLAHLALLVYRGEADFRQALFMQGQDTLVVIGGEEDHTYLTGAGGCITPPLGGDAKFIGVQSGGLGEMRHALENDKKIAAHKAAQMTDTTSRQRESGDALRVRVAAQTATLNAVADAGAEGLQRILRVIAVWMGEDPEKVEVKPNKDFTSDLPDGTTMKNLMEAVVLGLPWSQKSQHELIKRGGLTAMDYEEETAQIKREKEETEEEEGVESDSE